MGFDMLEHEPWIRLSLFLGVLLVVMGLELRWPRRKLVMSRWRRWRSNLGLVVLNGLLVRLILPVAAVALAVRTQEAGWGLFSWLDWPGWLEMVLAVVLLDLAIYLQHVLFHAAPACWRLHMVHHVDCDYDVTTGLRFHPIEILLSMLIKLTLVTALAPPPEAVLLFEVILNGMAMFNHGNFRIKPVLDRKLRLLLVTPDMHRVHHSVVPGEANSNFGFNLSLWDRLFGTYRAQPKLGHEKMEIGVSNIGFGKGVTFLEALKLPFVISDLGAYPIQKRNFGDSD
ncbi:MAG: sterol desaturase family protein [Magnetococcales bacterium]|nr:sterol desaturase family protein [Magnetococcales bacterium]